MVTLYIPMVNINITTVTYNIPTGIYHIPTYINYKAYLSCLILNVKTHAFKEKSNRNHAQSKR